MATWDDLKVVLLQIREQNAEALAGYPDPCVDRDRKPPFGIGLAPWATDVAAGLHNRFGNDVELTVGALTYPSCTRWRQRGIGPVDVSWLLLTRLAQWRHMSA